MRKLLFFAALLLLCVADDDIYEMGTPLNPKENLPYNDDVIVKTLVGMTLLCVAVFYFQFMPEDCSDMAYDGDELGVHYTVLFIY